MKGRSNNAKKNTLYKVGHWNYNSFQFPHIKDKIIEIVQLWECTLLWRFVHIIVKHKQPVNILPELAARVWPRSAARGRTEWLCGRQVSGGYHGDRKSDQAWLGGGVTLPGTLGNTIRHDCMWRELCTAVRGAPAFSVRLHGLLTWSELHLRGV